MYKKSDGSNPESNLKQAKNGSTIDFAQIYAATFESQYYLADRILHNSNLAEEVVQETYITFFENIHNIEHAREIEIYLYRVNYQLCLKHKNQQMKDSNDPSRLISRNAEELPLLSASLDKLSYHIQAALILKYVSLLSVTDIAFILEAPPQTVRRYIQSGLSELKVMPYKFKKSIHQAVKEEAVPGDVMLGYILEETNQSPVSLSVEILKPISVPTAGTAHYITIGIGLATVFLGVFISVFSPGRQSQRPGESSAGTNSSFMSDTLTLDELSSRPDIVPPIIDNIEFDKNTLQVTFSVKDDVAVNYQRISILANGNENIPFEVLEDGRITFEYPGSPVVLYVYDMEGHETRKKISE